MTREEAINTVRNIFQTDKEKEALATLIPELRESEDERTRKQLIDAIKIGYSNNGISFTKEAADRYIAWLEKQKESLHISETCKENPNSFTNEDERIRKFLVDYAIEMIAGLESDISLSTYDGIKGHDPEAEAELAQWQKARAYLEKQKDLDKMIVVSPEVWDNAISDAYENGKKDGEKQKEQKPVEIGEEINRWMGCEAFPEGINITPLPQAMEIVERTAKHFFELGEKTVPSPGGYWEGFKYGVRECQDKIRDVNDTMKEQKPAEHSAKGRRGRIGSTPEHIRKKAENFLSKMEPPYDADDICSAYETGAMENANSSWSEEDEKMLKETLALVETIEDINKAKDGFLDVKIWLESLPERFVLQPKEEWSKKDEEIFNNIIEKAKGGYWIQMDEIAWLIARFKSLRPQPHWKPSEEQMESLAYAIQVLNSNHHPKSAKAYQDLQTLYKNIKYGN